MKQNRKPRSWKKRGLVLALCVLLGIPLVVMPLSTVIVYEAIFSRRYETVSWMVYEVEDFPGLQMERSDFETDDGVTLAGYCYTSDHQPARGVVVLAHGLGGGGHNQYMPFIDCFTAEGYLVFAYDARGNDNSGGRSVSGLPEGVVDLDYALRHVAQQEAYRGLPVMLFGHSWGAYSAGSVLKLHPEVKGAVLIAGFNESEDMIAYQAEQVAGEMVNLTLPYVSFYEQLKFGKRYTDLTVVEGIESSEARVLVVHSMDDATVPARYGYDVLHEAFCEEDRVDFVLYEDRGHDYLFYSEEAWDYREKLNRDYVAYVEEHGGTYNEAIKETFMEGYLDKSQCFEPDPELMEKVLEMYEICCPAE